MSVRRTGIDDIRNEHLTSFGCVEKQTGSTNGRIESSKTGPEMATQGQKENNIGERM